MTWKVHCVTARLATFLKDHGRGMADVCEQVGEAAHHAMKPVLQRHKRALTHPQHGALQLAAVVKFGSWGVFSM